MKTPLYVTAIGQYIALLTETNRPTSSKTEQELSDCNSSQHSPRGRSNSLRKTYSSSDSDEENADENQQPSPQHERS
jgi:hypothetical protein